jgi:hypothetical protein
MIKETVLKVVYDKPGLSTQGIVDVCATQNPPLQVSYEQVRRRLSDLVYAGKVDRLGSGQDALYIPTKDDDGTDEADADYFRAEISKVTNAYNDALASPRYHLSVLEQKLKQLSRSRLIKLVPKLEALVVTLIGVLEAKRKAEQLFYYLDDL